ncbi:MAG: nucleotidyltransferase domain-containing protein [Lachnospiraceae bacterium]|nr:nucleotidyltransferase domain-containing protein [Lachnospiraceae bacterium]
MTVEEIKNRIIRFVPKYSINKIILFGSRAEGTNDENSDVDLIMEFSVPVSLITLSMIKIEFEAVLGLDVDVIHGPLTEEDMIEVNKEIVLYAA